MATGFGPNGSAEVYVQVRELSPGEVPLAIQSAPFAGVSEIEATIEQHRRVQVGKLGDGDKVRASLHKD
jgi:hypothetical protein